MSYTSGSFVADEQPTTAKWNILWSNDASFNDGTGIAAGAILSTHLAEAFFRGRQQSNTTNSQVTGKLVQYGWGFVAGTGAAFAGETVTFPVAFSDVPYVLVSCAGYKNGSDPSGPGNADGPLGGAFSSGPATASTFDVRYTQTATFTSNTRVMYIWMAVGTPT